MWFNLLWMSYSCLHFMVAGVHQEQVAVECITDGQQAAIYLHCDNGGLINILSAQIGSQELPQDTLICVPRNPDDCVVAIPDTSSLFEECMGRPTCTQVIQSPSHDRCDNIINYIQIHYQCIPAVPRDSFALVDICGKNISSMPSIIRSQGYIKSASYPERYAPLSSCTCNLTASDPDTDIRLQIIDMDLSTKQRLTVGHDWLEYTNRLDQWGMGHKLNHVTRGDVIDTESSVVYINFRSGAGLGGRGFWIQYFAFAKDGSMGNITIHCGQFTPKDYKTDISCFTESQSGELYLTCESKGLVNVLSAIRGYSPLITHSNCTMERSGDCMQDATQDNDLLQRCMGHTSCNPPAKSVPLACGRNSSYMYVLYQCIEADLMDANSHIDMCGDATQRQTIVRSSGYLETLNYPNGYISEQKCTCRLEGVKPDTEIVLSLVDLDLDSKDCTRTKSWIEFSVAKQNWARGVRLCGNVPGELIHTGANKIYLNFYSDTEGKGRGVWLKYMGKSDGDTLADVKVTCGQYSAYSDLPDTINIDAPPYYTGPNTQKIPRTSTHTGLIAGLTITAVFMIAITIVMLVFKYKRPRKQTEEDSAAPGGPPSSIARLDTGYGTLKYPGFSTRKNGHGMPYTNLDEDLTVQPGSEKASDFRDTSPIISRTPDTVDSTRPECSTSSNGSSTASGNSSEPNSVRSEIAYNNPAFDGNWERDQEFMENLRNVQI